MMQITPEQVRKYQEVYLQEHGRNITAEKAHIEIIALLSFVEAVHKHLEGDTDIV